jgi:Mg2+/Co2+ transporter CorB
VQNILNIPKPIWLFVVIIFALIGSIIGVSTHIDSLQFQQIENLEDKIHALDKQVAVNNERLESLMDLENRNENLKPDWSKPSNFSFLNIVDI